MNHGKAGTFSYNLVVPNVGRPPFRGVSAVIEYSNTGETDIPAQFLTLMSDNAKFRLTTDEGFENDIFEVMAISSDGPAGILAPGAHGRIEVLYEPIRVGPHFYSHFDLFPVGSTNDLLDWDAQSQTLRPVRMGADAWAGTFANFKTQVGTNTASLRDVLAADATHLSLLGQRVAKVDTLIHYELLKASDYGNITDRNALGIYGRGSAG